MLITKHGGLAIFFPAAGKVFDLDDRHLFIWKWSFYLAGKCDEPNNAHYSTRELPFNLRVTWRKY